MIPWRLKFSGVRDYPPTLLDLSGEDSHVMITGPNGSGKSTITFCMGAVLYSSKVDIEGLKSRNLQPNQIWKAAISFLFKNEGDNKMDVPDYVEFTLRIVQEPGQPIKKEYSISAGDQVDVWGETTKYTSGDRFNNFTSYKNDLKYKYKVDPDYYYLIWYQQEVNQFAVMNPEERFRIFSEMHGIDKVQRDWEESMEKVKDTEVTSRSSEMNVKQKKVELSMAKNALDRFRDNQARLHEGGRLYIESLMQMEGYYQKEVRQLATQLEQTEIDITELKEQIVEKKLDQEQVAEELIKMKETDAAMNAEFEKEEKLDIDIKDRIKKIQKQLDELDDELEDITKRKTQMVRTEAEVKEKLEETSIRLKETNNDLRNKQEQLERTMSDWQNKVQEIVSLEKDLENIDKLESIHKERLKEYKSSHHVQMDLNRLDRDILANKDARDAVRKEKADLEAERYHLEEGHSVSKRQRESLGYFKEQGVIAFPLSALVEMEEHANPREEQLFQAIKYTVFFDGRKAIPPNDLYHVPLSLIIPDQVRMNLSMIPLRVKEDLDESLIPFAIKALWWVGQFFEEGLPAIDRGILTDTLGIRGPQEKERYILSLKAILSRKKEVDKQIAGLVKKLEEIGWEIDKDTKLLQKLNGIIHQVKESEAFMLAEHEHERKREQLKSLKKDQSNLEQLRLQYEQENRVLIANQIEQNSFLETLEGEAAFYIELGKMKDKYEKRNHLQQDLDNEKHRGREQKYKLERLEEELIKLERKFSKKEKEARKISSDADDLSRALDSLYISKENIISDQDVTQFNLTEMIKELEEMKQMVRKIYDEASRTVNLQEIPSLSVLKSNKENGKVKFDMARNETGIDPAALENYETIQKEYERLDNEYSRTKLLLEQDKMQMENLRDQLETTINMRVIEIQQRFKRYMNQFQFEGDISWNTFEDRRKRVRFELFIKARKEGHRGSMEDVSIKARGGKVGKGVSGGEESLSSLLFALSLLQNLQTTPGFIVLDEFDSALDESRKVKVFDLYEQELKRKLIIVTPKSHENEYLDRFTKAFVVRHDPSIPESRVAGILKKEKAS